ncbi:MAG TPA: nitrate- and nitrite sensing domain-containing protein [Ramlibacter sp.]|nr:nitrate- and nitrite sensing domain-containing protein [Ramlibacter sp.]
MKSGLSFLLAARQCEIAELEQLAESSTVVSVIGRLTHALQRERGLTNLFLASRGAQSGDLRLQQIVECRQLEQEVRTRLDQLDTDASRVPHGARLFSRIAVALHALDSLAALRSRVADHTVTPQEALLAISRPISTLLAVVFEWADSATDPEISRALIAQFNLMQAKEFAGQERAFGAAVFASGRIDGPAQQQWRHLIDSQQRCFQVFADFTDFTDPEVLAAEQASQDARTLAELERLRRIGNTLTGQDAQDARLSQGWYDCCTRRIDAMKALEDVLARNLKQLCENTIARARADLRDQQDLLDALSSQAEDARPGEPSRYGPQLERSILGLVQEQAARIQAMSNELDTVRATLNERKVVERAKGLLMAHRQLTEEEAYKALRQMAMNQNRRLLEVAEAVLTMADILPGRGR